MTEKSAKQTAQNLKKVRIQKGLTQSVLAEKAGISTNYYARIERAEVSPTIETVEKISKALKVKSSEFLAF